MLWLQGFFWGFMGAMVLWISSLFGVYLIIVKTRVAKIIDDQLNKQIDNLSQRGIIRQFTPLSDSSSAYSKFISPSESQDYKQELNSKHSIDDLISDL